MVAPSKTPPCVGLCGSAWGALCALCAAFLVVAPLAAQGPGPSVDHAGPIVRAVLFYSPTCPHCRDLATVELPPILARYGDRLRIAAISVASSQGQALYQAMVRRFDLPSERLGVPTLVVGARVLVGSVEIPAELPGIVDRGLAHGGITWPDEPRLREALAAQGVEGAAPVGAAPGPPAEVAAAPPPQAPKPLPRPEGTASSRARPSGALGGPPAEAPAAQGAAVVRSETQTHRGAADAPVRPRDRSARQSSARSSATPPNAGTTRPASASGAAAIVALDLDRAASAGGAAGVAPALSMADRFRLDPAGNAAAVAMLLLIAAALALALSALAGARVRLPVAPTWSIPVLALAGLAVAAYLAFVEVTGTRAVCGPVGDCNTVQQSQYARLFGVLPLGVLGVAGYAALIVASAFGAIGPAPARAAAPGAVWAMALLATVFSAYLTFLEPFVIGATCAWCLASAAIAALTLVVATARLGPDRPWQGLRRFREAGAPRT